MGIESKKIKSNNQSKMETNEKSGNIDLNKSKQVQNKTKRLWVCSLCAKSFAHSTTRRNHLKTHERNKDQDSEVKKVKFLESGSSFLCPTCGNSFSKLKSVKRHYRGVHLKDKTIQCRFCVEMFKTNYSRNNHEIRRHGQGEKNFQCLDCEKKFVAKQDLKHHKERIHDKLKPFKCEICWKDFFEKSSLRKHKLGHFGIRKFNCENCPSTFASKDNFKNHIKKEHKKSLEKEKVVGNS